MAKSGGGGARGFANRRGYSIRGATDSQVARGYRYRVVGKGSRQGSFLARSLRDIRNTLWARENIPF